MSKQIIFFSIIFSSLPSFATEEVAKPTMLGSLMPLILIFGILYFFMIRPQQKKMKEREQMVNSLKIGNSVITDSGIYGTVSKINDKEGLILLEISKNNIIKIKKQNIIDLEGKKKVLNSNSNSKSKNSPNIVKKQPKKSNNKN